MISQQALKTNCQHITGAGLLAEISVQEHAAIQVLMLFAGLSTCDPGNIQDTIKVAKQQRVRVSIVGLAAEVHICRVITEVSPRRCALLQDCEHGAGVALWLLYVL